MKYRNSRREVTRCQGEPEKISVARRGVISLRFKPSALYDRSRHADEIGTFVRCLA